ncbi:MAG: hypothetical protein JXB19_10895 [Bacteroidales bacterium]|nr:hypothetical protein [Bacteroidales bacterium]
MDPNLDWAHYHYSWALYLWSRLEEAIAAHKKLAELYPEWLHALGLTCAVTSQR